MRFLNRDYPLSSYRDMADRSEAIHADAAIANRLYVAGYGLIGVGVATTSVGLFAMPVSGGSGVGVRFKW
jgi:hypothetical protein